MSTDENSDETEAFEYSEITGGPKAEAPDTEKTPEAELTPEAKALVESGAVTVHDTSKPKPAPKGKFMVKVQLSLSTTEPARQVLIYNKDKSVFVQKDAAPQLIAYLRNRAKSFWLARFRGGEVELLELVKKDQGW